jgi:hypothetical protein
MQQAGKALGIGDYWAAFSFTRFQLYRAVDVSTGFRPRHPTIRQGELIRRRLAYLNAGCKDFAGSDRTTYGGVTELWIVKNKAPWYCFERPCAVGQYIFWNKHSLSGVDMAHEYIHVLQWEGHGDDMAGDYIGQVIMTQGFTASHPLEAPAYLYEVYYKYFRPYYERAPWKIWKRPPLP